MDGNKNRKLGACKDGNISASKNGKLNASKNKHHNSKLKTKTKIFLFRM